MNAIDILMDHVDISTLDKTALVELIHATGKPDLAISKLFGKYEDPEIREVSQGAANRSKEERECRFVKYDPWADELVYKYRAPETNSVLYFEEDEEIPNCSLEKAREMKIGAHSLGKSKSKVFYSEKEKEHTGVTGLNRWNAQDFFTSY